jgi:formylglycine-generating enzyme required for sulfatase activity
MGSPALERGRFTNEGPQHRVVLRPFAVARFEVTFELWEVCVRLQGCAAQPWDQGWGSNARPVINVSWGEAQQFVAWLARRTGKPYRLLSEAEWEYAARAGSARAYPWGNEIGKGNANCAGCGSRWDGRQTAPVGSFAANAFGLFDVAGNVWEWVEDCYHDSYHGAPDDGSARSYGTCASRTIRGGSWNDHPQLLRSANRSGVSADFRDNGVGFRVARSLAR